MSTLRELIEKHGMGSGQKYVSEYHGKGWFEPKLITPNGVGYIGFDNEGYADSFTKHSLGWSLYTKPKAKVVRWLWAYKFKDPRCCFQLTGSFFSEQEIESEADPSRTYTKLEWSRTEFEE